MGAIMRKRLVINIFAATIIMLGGVGLSFASGRPVPQLKKPVCSSGGASCECDANQLCLAGGGACMCTNR